MHPSNPAWLHVSTQLPRCGQDLLLPLHTSDVTSLRHVWAQDRDAGEGDAQWELSRFTPLMQEVLEDLAANKLNFDEYPYVQPPTSDSGPGCLSDTQLWPYTYSSFSLKGIALCGSAAAADASMAHQHWLVLSGLYAS